MRIYPAQEHVVVYMSCIDICAEGSTRGAILAASKRCRAGLGFAVRTGRRGFCTFLNNA